MLTSRNTGAERLHPEDPRIQGVRGFASPTGGEVDLSRVVEAPRLRRRTERENAPALKARLKREKRRRNRPAKRS
jgi:hypothetical protein